MPFGRWRSHAGSAVLEYEFRCAGVGAVTPSYDSQFPKERTIVVSKDKQQGWSLRTTAVQLSWCRVMGRQPGCFNFEPDVEIEGKKGKTNETLSVS